MPLDLYAELTALTKALDGAGTPYALCGGIAVGLHATAALTLASGLAAAVLLKR